MSEEAGDRVRSASENSEHEYDPHYTPIITLPEVTISTNEEDEELLLKLRAKLYRFDKSDDVPEWKERGTGELKMLKHTVNKTVRIVMRRDKTYKVCANHFITPFLELKPKAGLEKAFVYTVPADFADEEIKSECFAIKFGTVEFANDFKRVFLESQQYVRTECKLYNGENNEDSSEDDEDDENHDDPEDEGDKENVNKSANESDETASASKKENDTEEVTEKLEKLEVNKENGTK